MATALALRPATADTAVEGVRYLLASTSDGVEWVARYEVAEMVEIFTAEQRRELAVGETIVTGGTAGMIRWADMVAAGPGRRRSAKPSAVADQQLGDPLPATGRCSRQHPCRLDLLDREARERAPDEGRVID